MRIIYTSDIHKGFSQKTHKLHEQFYQSIQSQKPDLYLVAGDIGTASFNHFKAAIKMMRESLECPIVICRGNHDLWDKYMTLGEIYEASAVVLKDYNVIDINVANVYEQDKLMLFGWEGWYGQPVIYTNDMNWIRLKRGDGSYDYQRCHEYLQKTAYNNFGNMLQHLEEQKDRKDKIKMIMTHMPIFTHNPSDFENIEHDGPHEYWQFLHELTDYFLYGHTHQKCDRIVNGIHCLNSGSDYDKPVYGVLDL
jgi:predicted phosphodiesterase